MSDQPTVATAVFPSCSVIPAELLAQYEAKVRYIASKTTEAIDAEIASRVQSYFRPVQTDWNQSKPSPIASMIESVMQEIVRERVKAILLAEIPEQTWDNMAKGVLPDIVRTLAPAAMEGLAHKMVHDVLWALRQQR